MESDGENEAIEAPKDLLSVVIGTYHCRVAQFDFDLEIGSCQRRWVDDSPTKSVAAIAFNGFFAMFGGNDELVHIVNVPASFSVGALHEHQGSITHLETFQNTHLFSSSDDGKIYIWKIGEGKDKEKSWECLCCMHNLRDSRRAQKPVMQGKNKKQQKHKKKGKQRQKQELEVSSNLELVQSAQNCKILKFSIHPSGRLLLSIDDKHEMKIWDLVRAKCIVTVKMPKPAVDIQWSPKGDTYSVVRENKVLIYHKEGTLHKVIKPVMKLIDGQFYDRYQGTIVSFAYVTHDMIAMADLSARVVVFDIDTKTPLFRLSGHEEKAAEAEDENEDGTTPETHQHSMPRIRNLKACSLNGNVYLVAADNRGRVCVWNVHDCLNRVIMINSANMQRTDGDDEDVEDDDESDDDDDGADSKTQQNGDDEDAFLEDNEDDDLLNERAEKEEEEDGDDDEEVEDWTVDEHGLFTFRPLIQVDTDTHITCMDVGVIGRLNAMYKWKNKRPRQAANSAKTEDTDTVNKKRTLDEMMTEEKAVDSDDGEVKKAIEKKKRKKKKKKKPKIDLSRFD